MVALLILFAGLFVTAIGVFWLASVIRARRAWNAMRQSYGMVPYGAALTRDEPEGGRNASGGISLILVGLAVVGAAGLMLSGRYALQPPARPSIRITDPHTGQPVEVPLTADDQRRMQSDPGAVITEKFIQVQQNPGSPP